MYLIWSHKLTRFKFWPDDACVLQSIGWMNNNFDFDEVVISSDIARYNLFEKMDFQNSVKHFIVVLLSLDPTVTGPLFAGHEECVAEVVDIVEDHE